MNNGVEEGREGGFQAQEHVCKGPVLEYGGEVRAHRGWTEWAGGSEVGGLAQAVQATLKATLETHHRVECRAEQVQAE